MNFVYEILSHLNDILKKYDLTENFFLNRFPESVYTFSRSINYDKLVDGLYSPFGSEELVFQRTVQGGMAV